MIIAGVIGSAIIPPFCAKLSSPRSMIVLCALMTALTLHPIGSTTDFTHLLALAIVLGFFFLPTWLLVVLAALVLAMATRLRTGRPAATSACAPWAGPGPTQRGAEAPPA